MFQYPADDLDRPEALRALLGSYWARDYGGHAEVAALMYGMDFLARQGRADLLAARDALAWDSLPPSRVVEWSPLAIRRSALEAAAPLAYGSAPAYGAGGVYGGTGGGAALRVAVPGLAGVPLICSGIAAPARTLVAGVDYAVTPGVLTLTADPFADPAWPQSPAFAADGTPDDAAITLWLHRAEFDRGDVATGLGYLLGLPLPSSVASRDLCAALLGSLAGGPSAALVAKALAAATGVPLAAGDETVEVVAADGRGPFVATDRAVYRLPPGATPVVVSGQALEAGDALGDALEVLELNRGWTAALAAAVGSLALPRGLLGPGYLGDLVAHAGPAPLTVGSDPFGNTTVTFPLEGFPGDVDRFWAAVHARGLARGRTLAQALDTRATPVGQPTAASLPATVDPLAFLVDNALMGPTVLVTLKAGSLPAAPGPGPLAVLRRLLPPGGAFLFLLELPPLADPVTVDPTPETLGSGSALGPVTDGDEPHPSADLVGPLGYAGYSCG